MSADESESFLLSVTFCFYVFLVLLVNISKMFDTADESMVDFCATDDI